MGSAFWKEMGIACVSCETSRRMKTRRGSSGEEFMTWPSSTVQVIHLDGQIEEFKLPVPAATLSSRNPNSYLCSSETMELGSPAPPVSDNEMLLPGQLYFLLPRSRAHAPLSLPDLCDLAIKASSILNVNSK